MVERITTERARLLREHRVYPAAAAVDLAGGRLAVYFPADSLSEGHSKRVSAGFYDVDDAPPWDTWLWLVPDVRYPLWHYLVSWVPPELMELAGQGMASNSSDCIRWAPSEDIPAALR
jgi:hypothetical protein